MDKTLQDHVWSILPKEFKEEVKKEYLVHHEGGDMKYSYGYSDALTDLFGEHNLTSDAEGEEILTVSRKRVQEIYSYNEKILSQDQTHSGAMLLKKKLTDLFGSKCLPDNVDSSHDNVDSSEHLEPKANSDYTPIPEKTFASKWDKTAPKPPEPKFKVGDIVRFEYCSTPHRIDGFKMLDGVMLYQVGGVWAEESDLEPYAEPTANYMQVDYHGADTAASTIADGCQSQPVTDCHDFNRILKDSFRDHNRLQIAAMAMQGLLSNTTRFSSYEISDLVRISLNCAEALIAESEKGGEDGED